MLLFPCFDREARPGSRSGYTVRCYSIDRVQSLGTSGARSGDFAGTSDMQPPLRHRIVADEIRPEHLGGLSGMAPQHPCEDGV